MKDLAIDMEGAKQALAKRQIEIVHHSNDIVALYFATDVKDSERAPLLRGVLALAGVSDADTIDFHLSALIQLNKPVVLNAYAPSIYEKVMNGLAIIGAEATSTKDFIHPSTNLGHLVSASRALTENVHISVKA